MNSERSSSHQPDRPFKSPPWSSAGAKVSSRQVLLWMHFIGEACPPGSRWKLATLAAGVIAASACCQTIDTFRPNANGPVYAMAPQPDGKILVGGGFTILSGCLQTNVGRLNRDGTVDTSFKAGADYSVSCVAVQPDGKVVVGGNFSTLNGQPRGCIGRLNAGGSLDANFNIAANGGLSCLAVQPDGKIIVGGLFSSLGGVARTNLGRINADGTLDTNFNAGTPLSYFYRVQTLALQPDGKILVGGFFTNLCGQARTNLGRLNANGTLDASFNPGVNGMVYSLAVQADGNILIGGWFTTLGGQWHTNIGRLTASGTGDSTFNAAVNDDVRSLTLQNDGRILAAGYFTTADGQGRNHLARFNANGGLDTAFNVPANDFVSSVVLQSDAKILVGGSFTALSNQACTNIGRLINTEPSTETLTFNASTANWVRGGAGPEVWRTTFEASTNGNDWTTLGDGTRIGNGWQLTGISVPANSRIRSRGFATGGCQDASSWFVESAVGPVSVIGEPVSQTNSAATVAVFNVVAEGSTPMTYQWCKNGVNLGDFGTISGAFSPSLTLSNALGADAGGYSVVISNSCGSVTSQVASLTVVDPVITVQPLSQAPDAGQTVALSVTAAGTVPLEYHWRKDGVGMAQATGASLILTNVQGQDAGTYDVLVNSVFGTVTSSVAVVTVNLALPDAFSPTIGGIAGRKALCFGLQPDGAIIVGGRFATLGNQPCNYMGRLVTDGTLDTAFAPAVSDYLTSLALQPDGRILVGGWFLTLDGFTRDYLGRLNVDGNFDTNFIPPRTDGNPAPPIALQPDGRMVVGAGFVISNYFIDSLYIDRLQPEGTPDSSFNVGSGANAAVYTLALQPDGKILAGGAFTVLADQPRNKIGRLNSNGTLDTGFNPLLTGNYVNCLALQADGKILLGGYFTGVGGQPRTNLARLNPDGTVDGSFNPGANGGVYSLVAQTDGRILVSGEFTSLGGKARKYLGRLNVDGSVDPTFYPAADAAAYALALQNDGKIIVGGIFTNLCGRERPGIGRLNNSYQAFESLTYDGAALTWLRGGTSPEAWRTTFEVSSNGTNWSLLGAGVRVPGGWQVTGVSAPSNSTIRARGFVTGGYGNASSWFVENIMRTGVARPTILVGDGGFGFVANRFGFNLTGNAGLTAVVQGSTDLLAWSDLWTNTLSVGPLYFSDTQSTNFLNRFYRVRIQ